MSFYNINNEEISQESILNDLIDTYNSLHEMGKTKIDDFHEGSEVRNLLEVISHLAYNILEEQNETLRNHFINTADGEYLDLLGSNPNVNLPRNQGTVATGLVKFSIPYLAFEEMIIPADLTVSSSEMEYVTVEDGLISIGDNYTYIPVECVMEGVDGNCNIGEINTCELSDYAVTNDEAFIDGSDFEEDEEYRTRLLDFIREDNFGSRGYYENVLLNMEGVHDILEGPGIEASIDYWVNTNDFQIWDEVYNTILEYFTDNNNHIIGHTFKFEMPHFHEISAEVMISKDCGYSEEDIIDFFQCYFKGGDMKNYPYSFEGLNIGESLGEYGIEMTDTLMDILPGTRPMFLTIKNIAGTETSDNFEFQYDPSKSAYSLENITVRFI